MKTHVILAALAASAGLSQPATANLLVNGGFETAPLSPLRFDATAPGGHVQSFSGGAMVTSQYLPGWTLARPFESDLHRAPSAYGGYPGAAAEGQQYLALNWSPAVYRLDNTITQAFVLGSGATGIELTLAMATEVGFAASPLTATITTAGGVVVAASPNFFNTLGNARWDRKQWGATLAPGNYLLGLRGIGAGNAWDVLVDDVVLTQVGGGAAAVPEPASWALMIGGFGLVGGAARRRRQMFVN